MSMGVLFVDDEPNMLESLRHRLHHRREQWSMHFADSGHYALDILTRESVDIIVTDMCMPSMDGITLLSDVRGKYPSITRIMLSGFGEDVFIRAMSVAHQFIAKPCESKAIEDMVERVFNYRAVINDRSVRCAAGKITALQAQPKVYWQLMNMLGGQRTGARDVAQVVGQDVALSAKLLQIANSAMFGSAGRIMRIEDAVVRLGLNTIRQLALVADVFRRAVGVGEAALSRLQNHALITAAIAAAIVPDPADRDAAFTAGLLHDAGKVFLQAERPEHAKHVATVMRRDQKVMHVVEREIAGTTHAEIGGYILGLWQLPFAIVEAVANHHAPERVTGDNAGVVTAVHVADGLANEIGQTGQAGAPATVDTAYLDQLGLAAQLPHWRQLAAQAARAQQLVS